MKLARIYQLAYYELLRSREAEEERSEKALKVLGKESEISINRIKKIDEEIKFVHEKILELEKV